MSRVKAVKSMMHTGGKFEAHVVGKVDEKDLLKFLQDVHLMLAPSMTEGTGIASKIFMSIESGLPFVSTQNAKRGFSCDEECANLFFADDGDEFIDKVISLFCSIANDI